MTLDLTKIRASAVLLVIGAYMILNHGFMVLRVPPAGMGIPFGEIVLLLFALTFVFELKRLPSFAQLAPLAPLLILWTLGALHLSVEVGRHGVWALRDATHLIDTLYLWIGYVVASSTGFLPRFSGWLRALLNIGVIYALLYPLRDWLTSLSPKIMAPAGYQVSIFFNYLTAGLVPLTAAMSWLVDRKRIFGIPALVSAGAIIVYCVAVFQMRTTYLQIIALILLLLLVQPKNAMRMSLGLLIGMVGLLAVLAAGVEITGRLGERFTFDFMMQHISAIWGASGEGAIHEAAGGVSQRLDWWSSIWRDLNSSTWNLFFGMGFGIPLTSFGTENDVIVREPHNSMLSMVARMGLVGLVGLLWLNVSLAASWFRAYRWARENGARPWANNMLILGAYFILVWVLSLGEDAFEKPCNAIPYYFFWGVILRFIYATQLIRQGVARVPARTRLVPAYEARQNV